MIIISILTNKSIYEEKLNIPNLIILGSSVGLLILIRPSYYIAFYLLIIYFLFNNLYKNKNKFKIKFLKVFFVFLFIILSIYPQYYINKNLYDINSPLVQTQKSLNETSLIKLQLIWGWSHNRYETYVGHGSGKEYKPNVDYFDPHASTLYRYIEGDFSVSKWIKTFFKKPVDFIAVYFRHFFNGLDILYSTPYVKALNHRSFIFSFLNYTLWYLFFYNFSDIIFKIKQDFIKKNIKEFTNNIILGFILLLLTLIGIVGAVETRFLIHLYVFSYIIFTVKYGDDSWITLIKNRSLREWVMYIVFIFMCFSFSTSITSAATNHINLLPNFSIF